MMGRQLIAITDSSPYVLSSHAQFLQFRNNVSGRIVNLQMPQSRLADVKGCVHNKEHAHDDSLHKISCSPKLIRGALFMGIGEGKNEVDNRDGGGHNGEDRHGHPHELEQEGKR